MGEVCKPTRREFKIWLQPRRVVEREINNLSKNTKPKVTTCWLLPSHFLFLVSYKYNPKRREEKAFCILTGEKENKNKGWFEEIMQQHLMQMQPMMAAYASPNQVTTDIIQQYLDENKQLILAILDNQNTGKAEECAENQAKLQRNLMYLAAIADSQQTPTLAQFPPNPMLQSGPRYMPHQAAQQLTPQSLLAARASMLYPQSPMSSLQQQAALHGQLGVNPGASSGFNILHSEASVGFPDFGRGNSSKQEGGSALSTEGRGGGNSARQSGDGTESLYLKGSEEEGN